MWINREQKDFWTWQHWPMMAKWQTESLMIGLQRMQYIMLLVWQITYRIKDDSEDYLTTEHDYLFQSFISTIKDDLLTHKEIFTLTQLLELFFWFSALWSKGNLHITQTTTEIRKTYWWFDNNTTTAFVSETK